VAALWHALLPMTSKMPEHRVLWREPALLLAGVLIFLRAVYLPWIELYPEEAYYWNFAQHLDIGYLDHPPLVAWLMALSTKVFGQTEFGVRFFALVCSLITSCFAYHLADLWHGRRAAAVAALLVQILPFFWMTGWIMTPDAPLTACWAGLLYFLARVFFDGAGRGWVGVGVCLGLGLLAKYGAARLRGVAFYGVGSAGARVVPALGTVGGGRARLSDFFASRLLECYPSLGLLHFSKHPAVAREALFRPAIVVRIGSPAVNTARARAGGADLVGAGPC
jgi:hypothetical protein